MQTAYPSVLKPRITFIFIRCRIFPFYPQGGFLLYRHMFRFISCYASHTVLITGIDFLRESTGRSEPQIPLC